MHRAGLAGAEVLAALVVFVRPARHLHAADDHRRRQQRGPLAHEQRDGTNADARAKQSHCPVATVRDAATRRTLIDDEVDELLAHTATTESPAVASAG